MYEIVYKPTFVRQFKKLPEPLKQEVEERIKLLRTDPKHSFLKTHKLSGRLQGRWSCSVNFSYRIVFNYEKPDRIVLLVIGDHDVYRK